MPHCSIRAGPSAATSGAPNSRNRIEPRMVRELKFPTICGASPSCAVMIGATTGTT
ncbi:hypothetical protein J4558_16445 [Leptolyngbya sp. 15MV]|nr:hypothetical protein J4558_16445 [Leptolyngbya sp. 15MV]